ncbi:olfactory receptor 1-like [Crotalus tigris]|uniref:olfactory receptor 1-like n=1 Tax=Crotalus tigris TaxID=88082 RepID=UPI00192F3DF4|nr:olfactory receptor 1-like [Crotalus tigris]XP_039213808.1 olfactory receptor 1-like [Crotalus tigris]
MGSINKRYREEKYDNFQMEEMFKIKTGNQTIISEFILVGFGILPELQPLLSFFFLIIYLATISGNLLIIFLVIVDHHLHSPMYFFLGNLSCLETCYSSIILPKMLANLFTGQQSISFTGCMVQFYLFGSCIGIETYLLAAMSYDRYVAICRPLHYTSIMHVMAGVQIMIGLWIGSFLANCLTIALLAQLSFCGPNIINHYFCDLFPLEKLACSDTTIVQLVTFLLTVIFTITPFLLTLMSYIAIIATILKISSAAGRQKAFSTCSSHLMVVSLFYGTLIIVYILPNTPSLRELNKVFSIFYTVLTPLINPLIYSLRNQEVHTALRRVGCKIYHFARTQASILS